MRKIIEYIFATLRDKKEFEVRTQSKNEEQKNTTFPVHDENGQVMSYAQDPVHVGNVIGTVMQNTQRRAKLI